MAADPMVDLRRRFTVEEYELMGRSGVLSGDDRTELLDGEIFEVEPSVAEILGRERAS